VPTENRITATTAMRPISSTRFSSKGVPTNRQRAGKKLIDRRTAELPGRTIGDEGERSKVEASRLSPESGRNDARRSKAGGPFTLSIF